MIATKEEEGQREIEGGGGGGGGRLLGTVFRRTRVYECDFKVARMHIDPLGLELLSELIDAAAISIPLLVRLISSLFFIVESASVIRTVRYLRKFKGSRPANAWFSYKIILTRAIWPNMTSRGVFWANLAPLFQCPVDS